MQVQKRVMGSDQQPRNLYLWRLKDMELINIKKKKEEYI